MQQFSQASHIGLIRDNNEDAVLSNLDLGLWLVVDGMGGRDAGEVASRIAKDTINTAVQAGISLDKAIQRAHLAILDAPYDGVGTRGMGSTVIALKVNGDQYQICWVGDSRAYLFSPKPSKHFGDISQNSLQQLSTDHTYVQELYQAGSISAEEVQTHPKKNIISHCLGAYDKAEVKVDSKAGTWLSSEWILLCSDGLTDMVADQEICTILSKCDDTETAVAELIRAALDHGGQDNVSVIIVKQVFI